MYNAILIDIYIANTITPTWSLETNFIFHA